jgi:hypothetical protein
MRDRTFFTVFLVHCFMSLETEIVRLLPIYP